jgi:hypothetical protein
MAAILRNQAWHAAWPILGQANSGPPEDIPRPQGFDVAAQGTKLSPPPPRGYGTQGTSWNEREGDRAVSTVEHSLCWIASYNVRIHDSWSVDETGQSGKSYACAWFASEGIQLDNPGWDGAPRLAPLLMGEKNLPPGLSVPPAASGGGFPSSSPPGLLHFTLYNEKYGVGLAKHLARVRHLEAAVQEWMEQWRSLDFKLTLVNDKIWQVRWPLEASMADFLQRICCSENDVELSLAVGTTRKVLSRGLAKLDPASYRGYLHLTWHPFSFYPVQLEGELGARYTHAISAGGSPSQPNRGAWIEAMNGPLAAVLHVT